MMGAVQSPPGPDRGPLATATDELARLRLEAARTRAVLVGLRSDIAEAERQLGSHHVVQLLEANEHLAIAALRAQSEAETAAETAAQALKEATRSGELDVLTQLPTRLLLMDRLAQAMAGARRRDARAAVLFLDLDNFKQINDRLGHAVGDQVLKEVACRLAGAIRAVDTVSRHGGDEFLVVMAEIGHAGDAVLVADKIAHALAHPCRMGEHEIRLGVSIGISVFPDDAEDADTLIEHADAAMYQAKRHGQCCCLYRSAPAAPVPPRAPVPGHGQGQPVAAPEPLPRRPGNGAQVVAAPAARELQRATELAGEPQMQALAFVAHELSHPLMALRAAAASLRRGGVDERIQQRVQAVVERRVNHLSRMVGDLLELSRASTGKLRLECRAIDLDAVLAEAVLDFRPVLQARHQALEVSVQPGPHPMYGDGVRLTQVIGKLLDNASKYTPLGGSVWLGLAASTEWLMLTVSDNGIGITPQALPRVFDPFVQDRHATGHDTGGLGIGLSVVRELVIAHGGTVSASSAGAGCGSQFIVKLPAGT